MVGGLKNEGVLPDKVGGDEVQAQQRIKRLVIELNLVDATAHGRPHDARTHIGQAGESGKSGGDGVGGRQNTRCPSAPREERRHTSGWIGIVRRNVRWQKLSRLNAHDAGCEILEDVVVGGVKILEATRVIIGQRVPRPELAAHGVHAIVVNSKVETGRCIRPVQRGVSIEGIGDGGNGRPGIATGVGCEFLHVGHIEGRQLAHGVGLGIVDQAVAVFDAVDDIRLAPRDGIIIAQARLEDQPVGGDVGASTGDAECPAVGVAEAQLVDQHAKHDALDVDDLRVLRGGVHPPCAVVAGETVLGEVHLTDAIVVLVHKEIVHHTERVVDRVHALDAKIVHETRVERINKGRDVPAEEPLELTVNPLRRTHLTGVVERGHLVGVGRAH